MRPETIYVRYKTLKREGMTDDIALSFCFHSHMFKKVVLASSIFLDSFEKIGLKTFVWFSTLLFSYAYGAFVSGDESMIDTKKLVRSIVL